MKLSTSVFSVAGLYLPLAAAATHEFHIYTGRENWWSGDGQVATSSCWFFDGQPSCDDVQNSVNGMLTLGDGDLSGSGRGCDCDGPGNACYGAPHEIERFEINVDEIGHVTIYPPGKGSTWAMVDTDNKAKGTCFAVRDDDFQCSTATSSHSGGSIFHCKMEKEVDV